MLFRGADVLAVRMPGRFFRKRMRGIVDELAEAMSVYIAGYYDRGYNFFVYMNTVNDLDMVTEYMAMLQRIRTQSESFNTKIRWHREQLQRHLQKVNANSFSGQTDGFMVYCRLKIYGNII